VGKKPPQSEKGGSHGLTPWTSPGLSTKEPKTKKNKKKKKNIFFFNNFFLLAAGDLAGLRGTACAEQDHKNKYKIK
jgi:hypothetical protein